MMPLGTATTTTISRLSADPPRATHRLVPMIIATTIPAMMHSAYARSGKPKTFHTPVGGLGMNSGSRAVTGPFSLGGRRLELLVQLVDGVVGDVHRLVVDEHGRGLGDAGLVRRGVDRVDPGP